MQVQHTVFELLAELFWLLGLRAEYSMVVDIGICDEEEEEEEEVK